MIKLLISILLFTLFSGSAYAQIKLCNTLNNDQKATAQKIMDTIKPYSCCSETITKCLNKQSPCPLAVRLANNICLRVKNGEKESKIRRRIQLRAVSMNLSAPKAIIDLSQSSVAGSKSAPVTLVVYACSRCPFCAKLVPELYDAVTTGPLKNKVKLYFKPFPLKSHQYSKEGGLAMVAAQQMGAFWPYVLRLYDNFDLFCKDKLDDWAKIEGMDGQKFTGIMKNPTTRNLLIASKKEGLVNNVKATPQLFINNRIYKGFLDTTEIIDILEEEYDRTR